MNDQQGPKLPFSSRQLVPGQLGYRQLSYRQPSYRQPRRERRRPIVGNKLLVIASLFLILAFLYAARSYATRNTTATQPVSHHPPANLNSQIALITSRVDRLLTNMVAHQQFSGSVLITHDDQVLLCKGYGTSDRAKHAPNTPHTQFSL